MPRPMHRVRKKSLSTLQRYGVSNFENILKIYTMNYHLYENSKNINSVILLEEFWENASKQTLYGLMSAFERTL